MWGVTSRNGIKRAECVFFSKRCAAHHRTRRQIGVGSIVQRPLLCGPGHQQGVGFRPLHHQKERERA